MTVRRPLLLTLTDVGCTAVWLGGAGAACTLDIWMVLGLLVWAGVVGITLFRVPSPAAVFLAILTLDLLSSPDPGETAFLCSEAADAWAAAAAASLFSLVFLEGWLAEGGP